MVFQVEVESDADVSADEEDELEEDAGFVVNDDEEDEEDDIARKKRKKARRRQEKLPALAAGDYELVGSGLFACAAALSRSCSGAGE